jgi:uncharacterized membrane protein
VIFESSSCDQDTYGKPIGSVMIFNISSFSKWGSVSLFAALVMTATPALADTDLTLCNKTGSNIDIAVAYQHASSGRWMLSAWHKRLPGECKIFARVKTGLFYYHAKNEKGAIWPSKANSERSYCVPSTAVNRDMKFECLRCWRHETRFPWSGC